MTAKTGRKLLDIDPEQVEKLAMMGMTEYQIAMFFGVDPEVIFEEYAGIVENNLPDDYMEKRLCRLFRAYDKISEYEKRKIRFLVYPDRKARHNLLTAMATFLHKASKMPLHKAVAMLGYSEDDLIEHLQRQFEPGMTWENYGTHWHIDHVIPQSWFIKQCWSLENLQPLTAQENIGKKDNLPDGF